jgi:hypothetical protein
MSTQPQFVVVVGAARSGTKFLRDLIGSSRICRTVPFDVNYVWRHGFDGQANDELSITDIDNAKARRVRRSLEQLSGWRASSAETMIVEKTVSNCLRVPVVDRALPGVRFVHLIRDGRDVAESCYRQWNAPFSWRYAMQKLRYVPWSNRRYLLWYARNLVGGRLAGRRGVRLWGVRYRGIEHDLEHESLETICTRQWSHCVKVARRDLQNTLPGRCLELRYEDLVSDETVVERVCDFLNLPDRDAVLRHYRENLRPNPVARPALTSAAWNRAIGEMLPQLRELGYEAADAAPRWAA